MVIRTQTELMIRRVQFIRRKKEAATQAACAGNTRGYHSEYGNSWFNNRGSDDSYNMFRSYNNCYYSSSEPVSDEEDELQLQSNLYLVQEKKLIPGIIKAYNSKKYTFLYNKSIQFKKNLRVNNAYRDAR